jgi:hypothetical protein
MKTISTGRILLTSILLFLSIGIFSCQKENSADTTASNEEQAANYSEEGTVADGSFDDVGDLGMVAADEDDAASTVGDNGRPADDATGRYFPSFRELRGIIGDCAIITIIPNDSTYPKTITIDFGDSCVGRDGKLRSGMIVLHLTGPIRRHGSVLTITFVNFYLNHIHLEGTKVISNLSEGTTIKFTVQVTGGRVTFPSGRGYSYACFKYKQQIAGMDTRTPRDNVFQITGWARIVFNNGTTVNLETIDPLIKKVVCPWISDGTLKIKINDRLFRLDYGFPNNGDCDNKALLSWNNGNSQRVIILP